MPYVVVVATTVRSAGLLRSEEHTSELQSRRDLVCRLLLEKKKKNIKKKRLKKPQKIIQTKNKKKTVNKSYKHQYTTRVLYIRSILLEFMYEHRSLINRRSD